MTERDECVTCYERDEDRCHDPMCLRVGCRLRNDALRSAARTGPDVAVKPLEWRDHSFDGSILWIARTPFDDYQITKEEYAEWPYVVRPFRTPQSNYQTIEEAKAVCEADYELARSKADAILAFQIRAGG